MIDRWFHARHVVLPQGVREAWVGVSGERIAAVVSTAPEAGTVEEFGGDWLLPGLVDTHVHINEPGRTEWEGFATATRAAAAGGVTTLVDMPLNSIPPTTSCAGLVAKREAADGRIHVDVGFCGGLVLDNRRELASLFEAGVLAFKCFLAPSGVDEFTAVDADALARGVRELAAMGAPLFVHAELPDTLVDHPRGDPRAHATWLRSRPAGAEDAAVEALFRLSRVHRGRIHVVHLSSAGALGTLQRALDEDVPLTAETCPHYLTFAAEDIPPGATAYKCAPPIREAANRDQLWSALRSGLLTQVVTDHSPAPAALKCTDSGDFTRAWGGIASLQIGLPAVWTEARTRGWSLATVVERMAAAPARLAGLGAKGTIESGKDADLVRFSPDESFHVEPSRLHHRHPVTPYAGRPLSGRVRETWLRGTRIYADSTHSAPSGRLLERQ